MSDFRNDQLLLNIQTTAEMTSTRSGTAIRSAHSSQMPMLAEVDGRIDRDVEEVEDRARVDRRVPATEEEHDRQRRQDEDVHVLGEEEEAEAHAAVLGREAGHDLAVRLGQVERSAVALSGGGDEEDDERKRLLEHVPVPEPAGLLHRRSCSATACRRA